MSGPGAAKIKILEGTIIDAFAIRHAAVLRELELIRERRADALRIAEERRAEIQQLHKLKCKYHVEDDLCAGCPRVERAPGHWTRTPPTEPAQWRKTWMVNAPIFVWIEKKPGGVELGFFFGGHWFSVFDRKWFWSEPERLPAPPEEE